MNDTTRDLHLENVTIQNGRGYAMASTTDDGFEARIIKRLGASVHRVLVSGWRRRQRRSAEQRGQLRRGAERRGVGRYTGRRGTYRRRVTVPRADEARGLHQAGCL